MLKDCIVCLKTPTDTVCGAVASEQDLEFLNFC